MTRADSDLDQALASIQTMRDVMVHLSAAADAALSGPPNDEIHRRWFVQLTDLDPGERKALALAMGDKY